MTHAQIHTTAQPAQTPKKRKRVFMWTFIAVQVVFLLWVILGANSGGATDCGSLSTADCKDASDAGTAIGVGLIIGLWAFVDVILGITYAVVRLARR
ncbi:hypothetical protein ACGFZA_16075 [Streptomyces sp. NPDC048211]|uniref:hypothetical protein n=1 Tax=Streptomyces sp. NPDC048211 TaxID=3365516 RepID=UPI0037176E98